MTSTRRIPSMYVDQVAWLVLESIERVITEPLPEDTGVLVLSTHATRDTMEQLAGMAQNGQISPLRFAGANPGAIAGLPCLRLGLRGPSLLLTSDPERSLPVAQVVARSWLRSGAASRVVLSVHRGDEVRTEVFGASG
ncbi:coronafacic acid synthetase component [Kribbella sandramycini]|uniref:Coronafacic acid synthetase component n=1 Tax=Kribbella sandramycini TaxID=60450 RepID=A0A7Y4L3F2_9ACTN|nr:coronafacic acid synthetase component [Kribbella sandramycini]MBB6566598.1 hypothetical protein [Kribbella sandramycini]NOL42747.1 coronafacic acid synthetase component [Kribbella sandramycini]